jgi:hypothetical protein
MTDLGQVPATNYQWDIPDYAISNYVATVNSGTVYTNFCKTNETCEFYWVDGGAKTVQGKILAFGQQLLAKTVFTVKRPNIGFLVTAPGEIRADNNYKLPGTYLHFGGNKIGTNIVPGIKFEALSTDIDGQIFFIQVGSNFVAYSGADGTNYSGSGSGVDNGTDENDYQYRLDPTAGPFATTDLPASLLSNSVTSVSRADDFLMYLMFEPEISGEKLPVPIKEVHWSWSATAALTNTPLNLWSLTSRRAPENPQPTDTDRYPQWTNHMLPQRWTPRVPPIQ